MKALLLNGERKNEHALDLVAEAVAGELSVQGWQAETIVLHVLTLRGENYAHIGSRG